MDKKPYEIWPGDVQPGPNGMDRWRGDDKGSIGDDAPNYDRATAMPRAYRRTAEDPAPPLLGVLPIVSQVPMRAPCNALPPTRVSYLGRPTKPYELLPGAAASAQSFREHLANDHGISIENLGDPRAMPPPGNSYWKFHLASWRAQLSRPDVIHE